MCGLPRNHFFEKSYAFSRLPNRIRPSSRSRHTVARPFSWARLVRVPTTPGGRGHFNQPDRARLRPAHPISRPANVTTSSCQRARRSYLRPTIGGPHRCALVLSRIVRYRRRVRAFFTFFIFFFALACPRPIIKTPVQTLTYAVHILYTRVCTEYYQLEVLHAGGWPRESGRFNEYRTTNNLHIAVRLERFTCRPTAASPGPVLKSCVKYL